MAGSLKNISFEYAKARVLSIEHISRVLIEWKLKPATQNLSNLKFVIERGESPSEMKRINSSYISGSVTAQEYVDFTPKMLNLEKVYYYRVKAIELFNGTPVQEFSSDVFSWDGNLDLAALYVVEEHLFEHRYVDGAPCVIFKKLHEGDRCTNCWDAVMKKVTKSNCVECKGTGFIAGYYPPIAAWIKIEPDPTLVQIAEWGKKQVHQTDIQFTNYPSLSVGDIIVEVKTNRFWRIANIRQTEKNRVIMLQMARLDEINRSDIEYKLTVPDEIRVPMLKELEERIKTPEF